MNNQETKKLILDFIRKQKIAVISTVDSSGKPESAVLEFGETENLEIIFDTFGTYRKYKNIQQNKNVSFVIGWDENITVQYEGEAYELSGEEMEVYKQTYFTKNPKAKKWETREDIKYFKVIPTWMRYSDLNVNPWKVVEHIFLYKKIAPK